MSSVSFCLNCSRVSLILFGLIFLLFGAALFSLTFWVRFDQQIESQLRKTLLSDPELALPELEDIKLSLRVAYVALFWSFVGMSSALAMVGFFALCGACSLNRPINGLLLVMLFLLILLKLFLSLAFSFFRSKFMGSFSTYFTISHRYNLTDATVFSERFACCGDENYQMSYNYYCQGLGQPNCHQILEDGFAVVLVGLFAFVGCAVLVNDHLSGRIYLQMHFFCKLTWPKKHEKHILIV